jgi:hypothetical protein
VSNPREPFAPPPSSFHPPEPGDFDESIFDRAAESAAQPGSGEEPGRAADDRPQQREGLPPGFRMRHESHYVDELLSGKARARIVGVVAKEPVAPDRPRAADEAPLPSPRDPKPYAELAESLDAIATCRRLFRDRARPAAERVALDLIEAEASRAAWLVQALMVLDEEPRMAAVPVEADALVGHVGRTLSIGQSPNGPVIALDPATTGLKARGDRALLTLAVAGMAMALEAAVEGVDHAGVRLQVAEEAGGQVRVEAVQDAVRIPASWRARFLDPEWTDRPGGRPVTVGLRAAIRIAGLHGGSLTLGGAEHGGCRLVLSLPRA